MESHSHKEDWAAFFTGTFLVAQGIYLLKSSSMVVGGTAGLALLLTQVIPLTFGMTYFLVNVPFYYLAWKRLGRKFTINSIIAVSMVSAMADFMHLFVSFDSLNPLYASVGGGLFIGLGMLILFRHRASLGGSNVLCLVIQDKWGISVGKSQLVFDLVILVTSLLIIPPMAILWSIAAAIAINMILWMNHKPTRYSVTYK